MDPNKVHRRSNVVSLPSNKTVKEESELKIYGFNKLTTMYEAARKKSGVEYDFVARHMNLSAKTSHARWVAYAKKSDAAFEGKGTPNPREAPTAKAADAGSACGKVDKLSLLPRRSGPSNSESENKD
ncbi:hypothetical protein BAUCODRAFT_159793 [Baudoinia panamericana UAMH 10762]|uniref:Uncharacterized protein n=1 Tax=Baudoinia panamericana (strain UAMH 10762) TaxID=717646 RepID=M2M9L5_BAUPA|nr:uncharacterized protein BAUCODRAFT_159793 [Baudoinia panamericana UAMH 10762]EMC93111.1 hypothetical protein BAUCODRAFT_159793 [Baudoinia panamericana UAMH 10762]